MQKLIEGKFPEWPEGVTGADIGEKYVTLRFDSFTVEGHYLEFWTQGIRKYMDKLGVEPAESTELDALMEDRNFSPISLEGRGIILGSLIAIGRGEDTSSMFTALAYNKPYTHKYVSLKDWLEADKKRISGGYEITYSHFVRLHHQFKDILGISLWFLCKRKSSVS